MQSRKYLNNAYNWSFDSKVIAHRHGGIVLEETYFYPEGGGQPYDTGTLNAIEVHDVQLIDNEVIHFTQELIPIDESVHGVIHSNRRYGFMQQHTAQHLLSACAHHLFGANTVGLHISEDYFTVDLDVKLDKPKTDELMKTVHNMIVEGKSISHYFVEPEALEDLALRKQPKVNANIRIIEIDGFDYSPCGGTHLQNTREIGGLFVKKIENYKSGIRLTLQAGLYAFNQLQSYQEIFNAISTKFAIPSHETLSYIEKLNEDLTSLKNTMDQLKRQQILSQIDTLISQTEGTNAIYYFNFEDESLSMQWLREKVSLLVEKVPCVVLGTGIENEKRHIVLAKTKGILPDMEVNTLFKQHLTPSGIKGGGNKEIAQGGCATHQDIANVMETLDQDIRQLIEKQS